MCREVGSRTEGKKIGRKDWVRPSVGDICSVSMRSVDEESSQKTGGGSAQINRVVDDFDSAVIVEHNLVRIGTVRLGIPSQQMIFDNKRPRFGIILVVGTGTSIVVQMAIFA